MKDNLIKNKINYKIILKYLFIYVIFYLLSQATFCEVSPFLVACYFALMWTGVNILASTFGFCFFSMLKELSLENLYITITVLAVLIFSYLFHKKLKLPMNMILVGLYALISNVTYFYYSFSVDAIVELISFVLLLLISLYFYFLVFQTAILRGFYYKLTINEVLAVIYLLITLGLGFVDLKIGYIEVIKVAIVGLAFFLVLINKKLEACVVALALSSGVALASFNAEFLGNAVGLLLGFCVFDQMRKYKMAFAVCLVDLAYCLYFYGFNLNSVLAVIPTLVGLLIILCLPKKWIEKISNKFYICESEMSMRNIVNITRKNLHRKFDELSNVFNEMKAIHIGLIKDELTEDQVVNMLTNEIMKGLCKTCLDKQKCFRSIGLDDSSVIAKLVRTALTKGKITLLDIPSSLAIRCNMVNLLIGRINQIVSQYGQFVGVKKDVNNVKYLLAEQLGAVSQIMLKLGEELDKNIRFDSHKESQILNELLAENIICSELLLYNDNSDNYSVNMIIKGDNAYNPAIEKIISKKLKTQMRVDKVQPIDVNGFYSVNLVKDNVYDIIFGLSHCTKTGSSISGDTHSLIRLGDNRFLLALCDGMGSGESANKTSALTIGLIENFYKAGFDNDMVIASVNKLLTINNQECFATLDLCLVDLNKEIVDFIKVGSPYSFVKHEDRLEQIEGGALPIGVLENVKPFAYKTSINTKSMIIMATDGITDAFKDVEDMADFINGIISINPQTVAQTIVDEAIRRNGNVIKDDMTVLVARTFLKNI